MQRKNKAMLAAAIGMVAIIVATTAVRCSIAHTAGQADADPSAASVEQPAEQEELRRTIEKQQRILAFKPIFGCEMYVARRGKALKETREDQSGWHLVVLAKNELGYHNLIKLVSRAWTDGFYMRPRTDHEDLERYKEGLIVS